MRTWILALTCAASVAAAADFHTLIFGGSDVKKGDPIGEVTAALYSGMQFRCSGTVIAEDLYLTAAHCVQAPTNFKLVFELKANGWFPTSRRVVGVVAHPRYDARFASTHPADIALIRFSGGIPKGYRTVTLAEPTYLPKTHEASVLAGYGTMNPGQIQGTATLRKVDVTIRDAHSSSSEVVYQQRFDRGACYGDSGGPGVFYGENGELRQYSVASRVKLTTGRPGDTVSRCGDEIIYTKVSAYLPWIEETSQFLRSR